MIPIAGVFDFWKNINITYQKMFYFEFSKISSFCQNQQIFELIRIT